ncbi:hypothetical protein HYC85_019055 [Camellia sinensis]|uniref:Large ribosomal subunit protein uL18 C-terminal eukaryotes domain-containing protein n=1 Tax=Camellia sinensis TaxID=4442 RepID=A0A7J7GKT4_CAMSI|nr:hypothetical protein HYC85_019055 [Camellia sinensis]
MVLASAYAHELPRYGLEVGLTNYAAAYCIGLLLARRVLKMLEMDNENEYLFKEAKLDFAELTDLVKVRVALWAKSNLSELKYSVHDIVPNLKQGALDGRLDIPHTDKRFSGFSKDSRQLDAEVHRRYIYGGHVATYMKILMEDEAEKYQSHFAEYIKRGIEPDGIEELYKKVHAAIRADPHSKEV